MFCSDAGPDTILVLFQYARECTARDKIPQFMLLTKDNIYFSVCKKMYSQRNFFTVHAID